MLFQGRLLFAASVLGLRHQIPGVKVDSRDFEVNPKCKETVLHGESCLATFLGLSFLLRALR